MPNIIAELDKEQHDALAARSAHPDFTHGDTVKVWVKVREGEKERLQAYEGVVIARLGSGLNESFTVRRIVGNEGVERQFPLHSPNVLNIVATRSGKVRRAKLYFLRQRTGKAVKLAQRHSEHTASK